jgi:hypothetical protein
MVPISAFAADFFYLYIFLFILQKYTTISNLLVLTTKRRSARRLSWAMAVGVNRRGPRWLESNRHGPRR